MSLKKSNFFRIFAIFFAVEKSHWTAWTESYALVMADGGNAVHVLPSVQRTFSE